MFEDAGFKPDGKNIKSDGSFDNYKWVRPTKMQSTAPNWWGDKGIKPSGIRQGSLGDCWFLAAASSLAEQPERIKRIAWNDSYDAKGAFRFYFWVRNKWHGINVDDRLPANGNYPLFAKKSLHNAWWFALLEKAYAKLDN